MAWNDKPLPEHLFAGKIKLYPVYGFDFKQAKDLCKKHNLYNRAYSYSRGGEVMKRLYTEKEDFDGFVRQTLVSEPETTKEYLDFFVRVKIEYPNHLIRSEVVPAFRSQAKRTFSDVTLPDGNVIKVKGVW